MKTINEILDEIMKHDTYEGMINESIKNLAQVTAERDAIIQVIKEHTNEDANDL